MYSMYYVSSNKDLHSVLFGGKVATDTQFVTFIILLIQGLYSVGHRLNHHCVTSFGDNFYLNENLWRFEIAR